MTILFSKKKAHAALHKVFRYENFRPGQIEVIKDLAQGRDCLVVMSTSAGKSLLYQIPAICAKGTALIVSPLISLMKDQVDELKSIGVRAGLLNNTLNVKEYNSVFRKLKRGQYDLLYITPERFKVKSFREALNEIKPSFLAIDESHCHISTSVISTNDGGKFICDCVPGDNIITHKGIATVSKLISRRVSSDCVVKIVANGYTSVMTLDHPVFLNGVGFVPCGSLSSGDCIVINEDFNLRNMQQKVSSAWQGCRESSFLQFSMLWRKHEASAQKKEGEGLRDLRQAICSGGYIYKQERAEETEKGSPFLFCQVLENIHQAKIKKEDLPYVLENIFDETRWPSLLFETVWVYKDRRLFVGTNDAKQSNEIARSASEGIRILKRQGLDWRKKSWRQWPTNAVTTKNNWRLVSFPQVGISCYYRNKQKQETTLCQNRLGGPSKQEGDRGGRNITQSYKSQGGRCSQGGRVKSFRLVDIESVERGSNFWQGEKEIEVFSIELDKDHTYFADGVLVHNCISQLGFDFRIDYRRLGEVCDWLKVPTIALTATATVNVQNDIIDQLHMKNPARHVHGFDRPNLNYEINYCDSEYAKEVKVSEHLQQILNRNPITSTIIYCGTRKNTEYVHNIVARIAKKDVVLHYHAGLKDQKRKDVQDAFMRGDIPIVVATNAFGMGINKSNIRDVIHYGIPGSVEAWYQEVGRAGRDGQPSECKMYYSAQDIGLQWYFISLSNPPRHVFEKLWSMLWSYGQPVINSTYKEIWSAFKKRHGSCSSEGQVSTAIQLLKKAGAIDPNSPRGQLHLAGYPKQRLITELLNFSLLDEKARRDRERLSWMLKFAEGVLPIRERILKYFGET